MNQNPSIKPHLATKPVHPPVKCTKPKMPGIVMAICIISLLLGLGGLVSSFFNIVSTLILSVVLNATPQGGPNPQALPTSDFLQSRILPTLVSAGLNLLVSPLLIVGSIGALWSKRWGLPLLRWTLILAAIAVVIKGGLTIHMQLEHLKFSDSAMEHISTSTNGASPSPAQLKRFVQPFHYAQIIGMSVFAFALFNAYLCGFFYLNSKQTKRYHGALK